MLQKKKIVNKFWNDPHIPHRGEQLYKVIVWMERIRCRLTCKHSFYIYIYIVYELWTYIYIIRYNEVVINTTALAHDVRVICAALVASLLHVEQILYKQRYLKVACCILLRLVFYEICKSCIHIKKGCYGSSETRPN